MMCYTACPVDYRSISGAHWRRKTNWCTDADLLDWSGIQINGQGRVVKLYLFEQER